MKKETFPANLEDDEILDVYTINSVLHQKSFRSVFDVTNKRSSRHSILKVCNLNAFNLKLDMEHKILKELYGIRGIVKCHNFQKTEKNLFLELEILKTDMLSLLKDKGSFSARSILEAGCEMIKILKEVHSRNFIHRDIKPENIMVNSSGEFYLIDFGFAGKIKNNLNRSRVEISLRASNFVGTPRYASIRAHCNLPLTPCDDIESLLYSLIFLYKKSLPWMKTSGDKKRRLYEIGQMKQNISKSVLCEGLPDCFIQTFMYLEEVISSSNIDYDRLIKWFTPAPSSTLRMSFRPSNQQINEDVIQDSPTHKKTESSKLHQRISRKCSIDREVVAIKNITFGGEVESSDLITGFNMSFNPNSRLFDRPEDFYDIKETEQSEVRLAQKISKLGKKTTPKLKSFIDMGLIVPK